MKMSQ